MRTRDVNRQVPIVAKAFAAARYQDQHPEASAELAHAFAARVWPSFVDLAARFLAAREILREQEAAPFN
ncbi:MAG TPA: hypothetical protein VG099_13150 [Gemmataceae bacterium]|jgi:hypothetical protein|nr:hypothetical protein [Gemmataceae bacterium]